MSAMPSRLLLPVIMCLLLPTAPALADDVVADDLIVQGDLCVGTECVDGEFFGFDALRIKGNNVSIHLEDTSGAGFASNDWGLRINGSGLTGTNFFSIDDRGENSASTTSVFRIDAGAGGGITLGHGSSLASSNTLSIGAAGSERRILHVATGVAGTDAVNLDQMNAAIAAAGAGAGGVSASDLAAGDAATLASAQAYADAGDAATLASAQTYADAGDAATLASAQAYADAGDTATLSSAQTYADAGDAATLASAQTHADAGDATTLASARSYADSGDAATLSSANTYTDTRTAGIAETARSYTDTRVNALAGEFHSFQSDVWQRLERTDRRIDRTGAMTAAMAQMTANAAGGRTDRGRIAVGIGSQNGHGALSVGYGRRVGERGSMTLGAAVSGSETSAGLGFGLDL